MEPWNFEQRQEAVLAAIRQLVQDGRIQLGVLSRIEELYAQGLVFEAERIAGLAIWVGKGASQETLTSFFEHFGIVLRALDRVSQGLRHCEATHAWDQQGMSKEDFMHTVGLSPVFSARLLQLSRRLPAALPTRLAERGVLLRHLVLFLAGDKELLADRREDDEEKDEDPLKAIEEAADQVATTLLTVGRQLWQVRAWQEWQHVTDSYEAFLDSWLGLSVPFGLTLGAVGQVFTDTPLRRPPLRRLEMLCILAAGRFAETGHS